MKVKMNNGVVKDLKPHMAKAAVEKGLATEVKTEKKKAKKKGDKE